MGVLVSFVPSFQLGLRALGGYSQSSSLRFVVGGSGCCQAPVLSGTWALPSGGLRPLGSIPVPCFVGGTSRWCCHALEVS